MNLAEYEQMVPHVSAYDLTWITPNQHCSWRVESLLTKEPDTIAWINTMQADEVLYDVGANMGQYSLLAAKRGVFVHAFEPESQNFALLCRNIAVNKLGGFITPWPLALSDKASLGTFHVTQLIPGGSCNSFGESVDYNLKSKDFAFQQGCGSTTLDYLAGHFTNPNYIKIDVDGFEHKVISGGSGYALQYVKSVLIETNTNLPEHLAIEGHMRDLGFLPDHKTADIARRKEGPFEGVGNVIYFRSESEFLSKRAPK